MGCGATFSLKLDSLVSAGTANGEGVGFASSSRHAVGSGMIPPSYLKETQAGEYFK
jgi:hypothetical protein